MVGGISSLIPRCWRQPRLQQAVQFFPLLKPLLLGAEELKLLRLRSTRSESGQLIWIVEVVAWPWQGRRLCKPIPSAQIMWPQLIF